tara:strand:+ start:2114 stop:2506 length:393 start_codon:yes stop_codon:yes gene_type:complete
MASYSQKSQSRLQECHQDLIDLFGAVVQNFDNTILTGHRNKEDQNLAYFEGKSQLQWPNGKHNKYPSIAIDVAPYPIDWEDRERFTYFAGYVKGIAKGMGINIRWGGDWDSDTQVKDNSFDDLVHFELIQ